MLDRHDERTINANVGEVLIALHANLTEHKEIVAEARLGYVEKCKIEVVKAMNTLSGLGAKLGEGEVLDLLPIIFVISPPKDHSREFETVIKMLELHQNAHVKTSGEPKATIELKATDVQRFVLNDWGWMDSFLLSNSVYSAKSQVLAAEKGLM